MAASLLSTHQEESTVRKVVRKRTNQWLAICQRLLATAVVTLVSAPMVFASGAHQIFELGDFALESGVVLPSAKLSYVTHGELIGKGDNAILVPSAYLGDHHGFDFLIKTGLALDPPSTLLSLQTCSKTVCLARRAILRHPLMAPISPHIHSRQRYSRLSTAHRRIWPHPYQGSDRLFHGSATGFPVGGQPS